MIQKNISIFTLACLVLCNPSLGEADGAAVPSAADPATYCRFVPERADDFAWENDLVAFRTYGPALRKGGENSGIDCWMKRVDYPIIDKWYRLKAEKGLSYHKDHGEGLDFYHVGKSRGCGGTAIWHNGGMLLSNVFNEWEILESSRERSVFRLTYEYELEGRKIEELKTISIELGQRLFLSESVFTEDGEPVNLEIAVGLTTHDQRGNATLNPAEGWMSVWENHHGKNGYLGTGVVMNPADIVAMQEIQSDARDDSHAVLITRTDKEGRTVHYAGFAWRHSGDIRKEPQWTEFLTGFVAGLESQ